MLKYSLTILSLILAINCHAQKLDHVQGELIIQLQPESDKINTILKQFQLFQNNKTKIKIDRCLSQTMNIWLMKFDFVVIDEKKLLRDLRKIPVVLNAQFNHLIAPRNTPNDPNFNQQWQYINDGASNGNLEADLDADLAWDITTGGTTINGDTIVLCALDNGVNLNHEDLVTNLWRNYAEIPNNGIDDDANGYVDDVFGWNAKDATGNVGVGNEIHGTPIMGIMGAKGNNGVGVTGVNWDVKLMMVKTDFFSDEATLLAGYSYPLAMRKLYNESDGKKGAFVVATNSSWGIEDLFPEDAPIWCALYDSLGNVGILNCGASPNANTNVDVEGDLPTTCSSDYLIGVTSLNRAGTKVAAAGYGQTNIDLGAFGERIYTLSRNNYGEFSGTSFATPHVVGAIGLLYAAPCNDFGKTIKNNPSAAALLVRNYILNGTKPNESLENITVTEGQLNLSNSLQLLMQTCGDCTLPLSVSNANTLDTSTFISWIAASEEINTSIRYRIKEEDIWNEITAINTPFLLASLQACTNYEYQLKNNCGNESSGFGKVYSFQTDGCCTPPENIVVKNLTSNSLYLEWDSLLAAENYEVSFSIVGMDDSQLLSMTEPYLELNNLVACTDYEIRVRTVCKNQQITDFSQPLIIKTNGCGACTDVTYCSSSTKMEEEWISKVTLNDLINESGSDVGYGDYTGISTDLNILASYELTINIGYASFPFDENIQAWIDFNQDGIFDEITENIINLNQDTINEYTGMIEIPADAKLGLTRMRIAIKWREGNDETKPKPCDVFDFGEVEDYCVNIIPPFESCTSPRNIMLMDNSIDSTASVSWSTVANVVNYKYRYKIIGRTNWIEGIIDTFSTISISELEQCETYEFQVQSICDSINRSDYSEIFLFNTQCGVATSNLSDIFLNLSISPNPFIERIQAEINLAKSTEVKIGLLDISGKYIIEESIRRLNSGKQIMKLDANYLPSGIYLFYIRTDKTQITRKVVKS